MASPSASSKDLKEGLGAPNSARIIRRRLSQVPWPVMSPNKTPFYSMKNMKDRVTFARTYADIGGTGRSHFGVTKPGESLVVKPKRLLDDKLMRNST